jgi:RNA polymerase sigma-70 factor, ECF subfamily
MDEKEAISRLKRGDISGLEELVLRYQDKAMHAAYLIVQDRPIAEDVAQNAFLQAYCKMGQFDDSRPFGPWFLRSVVNAAIKAAKRRDRSISLEDEDSDSNLHLFEKLAGSLPSPEAIVERAEIRQQVKQSLEKLSSDQRAAVVLRYYLELNETQMTEEMHRPATTINWWLHSAKKRLREILRPAEGGQEESNGKIPPQNESKE